MAKTWGVKFPKPAWNEMIRDIVDTDGIRRMRRVADACNGDAGTGDDGYKVSTEGDEPLAKHSYRATVITATSAVMQDNASNNTLVKNFYKAGGD